MKRLSKEYLIILIVSIIVMFPMFIYPYRSNAHDINYHVSNVLSFKEQLISGNSSLIVGNIARDFGDGTRIFYPVLPHTVTAFISIVLDLFGLNVLAAFKVVHFFTVLLAGITMYKCAYKFSVNKIVSLFSSIIYITMPYFLSDIYVRCALAESFIFIFMPMIFYGVLLLLDDDTKHFYLSFIVGYVGCILSHLVMTMYFTIFLSIFLILYWRKVFNKKFIIPFIIATTSVILIVLPSLELLLSHKVLGDYVVFEEGQMVNELNGLALQTYINPLLWINTPENVKTYFIFGVTLLLTVSIIFIRKVKFPKYSLGMLIFGLLAVFMNSLIFPWDGMPNFIKMIQFPWRLLTFISFSVSLIAPLCLKLSIKFKDVVYMVLFVVIIVGGYMSIPFSNIQALELNKLNYNYGMGLQFEYLPVSAKNNLEYLIKRSHEVIRKNNEEIRIDIIENNVPNMVFEVTNIDNKATIEMPRLFYLGYNLTKDGKEIEVYENSNGFLEAEIEENGRYILEHKPTITQSITRVISLLTSIGLIIIYIVKFIGKKKRI